MEIINESALHQFGQKHPNARRPLSNWIDVTKAAVWKNFSDVRLTFRSADYVKDLVIFDVGGNNFRLIALIDYPLQRVHVLEVMTHTEYDRWQA